MLLQTHYKDMLRALFPSNQQVTIDSCMAALEHPIPYAILFNGDYKGFAFESLYQQRVDLEVLEGVGTFLKKI